MKNEKFIELSAIGISSLKKAIPFLKENFKNIKINDEDVDFQNLETKMANNQYTKSEAIQINALIKIWRECNAI